MIAIIYLPLWRLVTQYCCLTFYGDVYESRFRCFKVYLAAVGMEELIIKAWQDKAGRL